LTVSAAGCDGGTGNAGGGGGSTIAIEQLQPALVEAVCASATICKGAFPFTFASSSTCVAMLSGEMTDFPELIAAVQSGKVAYNGAEAAKCIQAMRNSCAFFEEGSKAPAGCDKTFVGSAADGAACDRDEVCKSAYCKANATQGCAGACAAKVAAGEACEQTKACAGTLVCAGGKCVENLPAKKDAPCEHLKCEAGLYCDHSTIRVCTDLVTVGGKCDDGQACAAGSYCKPNAKTGPAVCTALGKAGEACGPQGLSQGISGCESGLVCAPDSKSAFFCVTRAKLGEACTTTAQCGTIDTACGSSGKCEALPGKGAACTAADQKSGQLFSCLPPSVCDATAKKCVDLPTKDAACVENKCAKGFNCINNVCKAPPGSGEACDSMMGLDCAKGLVCGTDQKCAAPVCK